jgi:hypothetical protein
MEFDKVSAIIMILDNFYLQSAKDWRLTATAKFYGRVSAFILEQTTCTAT